MPVKEYRLNDAKEIDLNLVDHNTLVDIREVEINPKLSKEQRLEEYIQKIKTPYCFRWGKLIVKLSFNDDGKPLEDCLMDILKSL